MRGKRQIAKEKIIQFKIELKKSLKTAFIAAFGFLIALVWRDLITEYLGVIDTISPIQGKLFSALIITLISVAGIMLSTKMFQEK